MKLKEAATGYVFLSPWAIGFLALGLYPMAMSLYYSLCRYDVLRIPQFIGLDHYRALLVEDPYFLLSVWNTLVFTLLRVPLAIVGSLALAVLASRAVRGMSIRA